MNSYDFTKPVEDLNGYDPRRDGDGYSWDPESAARAVRFFETCLIFTSGAKANQKFVLERHQRDFIATLYGWLKPDRTRRYREAGLFVPRKNGKTEQGAGHALYGLGADKEVRGQIYSAAFTRDQASKVFEPAADMVEKNPNLTKHFKVIRSTKRITHLSSGSYYTALAAEAANVHGTNPHLVLFDELHTQKNRDLYDALKTGMGARTQPLFISMSTAGTNRHSICWEVWQHARNVRDGIVRDPTFLPLIYEPGEADDWKDEATWKKCNPNLGVTISMDFLRQEFERAKSTPLYENTFRNLYLNEWTEQQSRWFSMTDWDACTDEMPELDNEPCYAGLDMSTVRDVTAFVMAFPIGGDRVAVVPHFWVPRDTAVAKERSDRVPYRHWADMGLVTLTSGASVDHSRVRADIVAMRERYDIREIVADRWNAHQLLTELEQQDGFTVVTQGQGFAGMNGPAKEFERLVIDHKLVHGGNPVLRWMASNVQVDLDPAGNIKPTKAASMNRIDGIVAAIMGCGRAVTNNAPKGDLFVC